MAAIYLSAQAEKRGYGAFSTQGGQYVATVIYCGARGRG